MQTVAEMTQAIRHETLVLLQQIIKTKKWPHESVAHVQMNIS